MFFESKDCMKGDNNTITLCDNFIFFKTDKQLLHHLLSKLDLSDHVFSNQRSIILNYVMLRSWICPIMFFQSKDRLDLVTDLNNVGFG
ncbi:hypothetical protein HaMNV_gp139 [Helicoverpa armigera multiple nucleopolyhedrovirus]|uniref:Orf139 n=1 Tax=Mamestra brassicae nuclear polyhedrosis virus TaxID=78219 RepID=A0A077D3P3_NPVMB|nr:hypothetical protein HaMNV_gp139 [Helicoverpa armigera multiple nucleopolyhedrovirus]AIL25218.1 Orf139 [Mamestra brassicae multiple nucleopolyhedrovirus]